MNAAFVALFAAGVACAIIQPGSAAPPAKYSEKVLYSFCSQTNCPDGAAPLGGVIDVKGTLYGTTGFGGNASCDNGSGCGALFSFDPKTGSEKALYAFCSQANCTDGAYPAAGLIAMNGILFGTTSGGGDTLCSTGCGTLFSVDPATRAEKTLYTFCSQQNCAVGARPFAGLMNLNGTLYGTTLSGGNTSCRNGCGTVFSLDPATGAEKVLYSFCNQLNCADGSLPFAGLTYLNGLLYGTTGAGGLNTCGGGTGCGTVFSLDPNTGAETVLHTFGNGADGKEPQASLIAVNGTLYGTTDGGGNPGCLQKFGCGVVFSLDPNTGAEKVLYAFCSQKNCTDGANPAGLINVKGTLYGTASAGGNTGCGGAGCGIVFSIGPKTGSERVLHTFGDGTDGQGPGENLIDVKGTLYGTTEIGGAYGLGTVFALTKR
jgi:uncharacterized repeat protein (TIGR03803 family)